MRTGLELVWGIAPGGRGERSGDDAVDGALWVEARGVAGTEGLEGEALEGGRDGVVRCC